MKKEYKIFGEVNISPYIYYVIMREIKSKVMKKEMKDLDAIIENVGMDAVMRHLKSSHADKVFIPNWFYQEHLENMGFDFSEATMWDF